MRTLIALLMITLIMGCDERNNLDEWLGEWNAIEYDATIRIYEMDPICKFDLTVGNTISSFVESSRDTVQIDEETTNIAISVLTSNPNFDEFHVVLVIDENLIDTIGVFALDGETGEPIVPLEIYTRQ